jgi:hypothetical protein
VSSSVVPPANDAQVDGAVEEALELVHHHPGRLRVRAESLRNDEPQIDRVKASLEGMPGITRVVHNEKTGSFLVEYEPGLAEPDAVVVRIAEAAGLLSPFDPRAERPPRKTSTAIIGGARGINAVAHELTGGRADLRVVVPAALAGLAAYSWSREKMRLPRWDNLLWWSYSLFTALHASEIERATGVKPTGDGGVPVP